MGDGDTEGDGEAGWSRRGSGSSALFAGVGGSTLAGGENMGGGGDGVLTGVLFVPALVADFWT